MKKAKAYKYEWTTAAEIIANKKQKRAFVGWGDSMSLTDIVSNATDADFIKAHELWLKLKDAFNAEAATYDKDAYNSRLGSIGEVESREVLRSVWWEYLNGSSNGDYGTLTSIIEALHYGEKLETGTIHFGS